MPLQPPPADLTGFPARRSSAAVRTLYRIFWHRDRTTGAVKSPWRFASLPSARSGRFDLPDPDGTCYWSDRRYGAWIEVFRGVKLINGADVAARRLWTGEAPVLRLANLRLQKAYPFGVTAAISTQPDYTLPQQWAAALKSLGFQGVVGSCSHDPASKALNVAVFGASGSPTSRAGWTNTASSIETDPALLRELAAFGVHVAAVPYDVKTVPS